MDLIYTNAAKEDVGVMKDYTFDLAFGADENDFQCQIVRGNHCCEAGFYLYNEGTEYGGIIDSVAVDTDADTVTYHGRTWHGILESKVIEPLKEKDESTDGVIVKLEGKNLSYFSGGSGAFWSTISEELLAIINNLQIGTYTVSFKAKLTANENNDNTMLSTDLIGLRLFQEENVIQLHDAFGSTEINTVKTFEKKFTITPENIGSFISIRLYGTGRDGVGATGSVEISEFQIESGTVATEYKPYKSLLNEYLVLTGEANSVLQWLIDRMELSHLFVASTEASGITISSYKMNRYISGYKGIRKMLKASGAKLMIAFKGGMVELSAVPLVDYSEDEQFDTDQIAFAAKKNSNPINHVICLGKGDLAEREVIHVYADSDGNLSHTKPEGYF